MYLNPDEWSVKFNPFMNKQFVATAFFFRIALQLSKSTFELKYKNLFCIRKFFAKKSETNLWNKSKRHTKFRKQDYKSFNRNFLKMQPRSMLEWV